MQYICVCACVCVRADKQRMFALRRGMVEAKKGSSIKSRIANSKHRVCGNNMTGKDEYSKDTHIKGLCYLLCGQTRIAAEVASLVLAKVDERACEDGEEDLDVPFRRCDRQDETRQDKTDRVSKV